MALSAEFAEHLRDLFGALGPVETRRMFGGAGVYLGDAMFALVIDDTLRESNWARAAAKSPASE